jgi:hypothetical protein
MASLKSSIDNSHMSITSSVHSFFIQFELSLLGIMSCFKKLNPGYCYIALWDSGSYFKLSGFEGFSWTLLQVGWAGECSLASARWRQEVQILCSAPLTWEREYLLIAGWGRELQLSPLIPRCGWQKPRLPTRLFLPHSSGRRHTSTAQWDGCVECLFHLHWHRWEWGHSTFWWYMPGEKQFQCFLSC